MKLVALIYTAFGLGAVAIASIVLMNDKSLGGLDSTIRIIFGILLMIYGLYRVVTGIKSFRNPPPKSVHLGELYHINHDQK